MRRSLSVTTIYSPSSFNKSPIETNFRKDGFFDLDFGKALRVTGFVDWMFDEEKTFRTESIKQAIIDLVKVAEKIKEVEKENSTFKPENSRDI